MKARIKKQGGFTLIELVIVMVIIGILSTALVTKYVDLTGEAVNANRLITANALDTYLVTQIAKNQGEYPTVDNILFYMENNMSGINDHGSVENGNIKYTQSGHSYWISMYTDTSCQDSIVFPAPVDLKVKCIRTFKDDPNPSRAS